MITSTGTQLRVIFAWLAISLGTISVACATADSEEPISVQPRVEIEEDLYTYEPADNGAGPMWCSGSTCLVRIGDDVFASGLETIKDARPLNNCRCMLFKRSPAGWEKVRVDETGRT